jgi:hypothetical protein
MVSLSDEGSANCEDVQRIPYTNILGLNEVSHLRVAINFGFGFGFGMKDKDNALNLIVIM